MPRAPECQIAWKLAKTIYVCGSFWRSQHGYLGLCIYIHTCVYVCIYIYICMYVAIEMQYATRVCSGPASFCGVFEQGSQHNQP